MKLSDYFRKKFLQWKYLRAFIEPHAQFFSDESKKSKLPANDENLSRKLTSSGENIFVMQTQIH